jgi:glycosyltransferase involved in cell wall biosynthesis
MMLTVSVVIPTYNGARYLADAVRSVLAQSYGILEIIVVDDGSREDIQKLLMPFFPKVTYVRQDNAGPAAARNHGISLAKGDLVAFLDDDDVWHCGKTEAQVACFQKNPSYGMVYSYPLLIDMNWVVIPNKIPDELPAGNIYPQLLRGNRITSPSAIIVRREVFQKVGMFDENRECMSCEDYDLFLRIATCYEVGFCLGSHFSYRVRDAGISHNLDHHLNAHLYLFKKLISQHSSAPTLDDREFYSLLDINIYRTLTKFAYHYHHQCEDRNRARQLMSMALFRQRHYYARLGLANASCTTIALLRRYPYQLKDIGYYLLFSLSGTIFQALRTLKRTIAARASS